MGTNKISCEEVRDILSSYHDNELSDETAHLVSEHIDKCPTCSKIEEDIFQIKSILPELNEDVPFYLRNRLYFISESSTEESEYRYSKLKWVAAMIGAVLLFLNLFYFTNIYPSANRVLHRTVSKIETFVIEAKVFIEQIGGSEYPSYLKENKKLSEGKKADERKENSLKSRLFKGVNYG